MSGRKFTVLVATVATILSTAAIVAPAADAKPKAKPPAKVSKARVAAVSRNAATITWTNPKSKNFKATVVRIATGTRAPASAKAGRAVATVSKKKHAVAVTRLAAGTTYTVGLFTTDGKKLYSKSVAVRLRTAAAPKPKPKPKPKPVDRTAPGAVRNVTVTVANGAAHLTWTPPGDADFNGVVINRSTSATGARVAAAASIFPVIVAKGVNSFDDKTIEAGKSYTYSVQSKDTTGNAAGATTAPAKTVAAPTGPVTPGQATASSTRIELTWTAPQSPTYKGVRITRNGTLVADVPAPTTSYAVEGLTQGTAYSFVLTAYNTDGVLATGTAPVVNATTAYAATGPVANVSTSVVSSKSIKLTWTNPSGIQYAGVTVVRKAGAVSPSSPTDGVAADVLKANTSYTDTGLTPSTQYTYALFAYNAASPRVYASDAAPSKSETTSAAPVTVTPPAIIGTVTRADTHLPTAGVVVGAYRYGDLVQKTTTAADGTYTLTGLPAGRVYSVVFDASKVTPQPVGGLQSDYVDDVPTNRSAVTDGIDTELKVGSAIAGKVSASAAAIKDVNVLVFELQGGSLSTSVGSATTGSDGKYTVSGLAPSASGYAVCFDAKSASGGSSTTGYLSQCNAGKLWAGGSDLPDGATRTSTVAGTTKTVDASLVGAAAISGTVKSAANSSKIPGVDVYVYDLADGELSTSMGSVKTGVDGTYRATGLIASRNYGVCFATTHVTSGTGYVPQCWQAAAWNGVDTPADPTPVTPSAGATTSGINASLAAGGSVAGAVFGGDSSTPLKNVSVSASTSAADDEDSGDYVTAVLSQSGGTYSITGLPTGTYDLCFYPDEATGGSFAGGYLSGCLNKVSVTAGESGTGQDITLGKAAGLKGSVTAAAGGSKLAGVEVTVLSDEGDDYPSATTDANGNYTIVGLDGSVNQVCFDADAASGPSTTGYLSECSSVSVTLGAVTTKNVALATAAALSGKVTGTSGAAVRGARVLAISTVQSHDDQSDYLSTTTATDGSFSFDSLSGGDYYVCVDARNVATAPVGGYIPGCAGGVTWTGSYYQVPSGATATHVTAGSASTTNVTITVGGSISGKLTAEDGGGALSGAVELFDRTKDVTVYGSADSDTGEYSFTGLVPGTYYVCFAANDSETQSYAPECWNNLSWTGDDDSLPNGVTAITVKAGADLGGTNGAVPKGAEISGAVSPSSNGGTYSGVEVFDDGGHYVKNVDVSDDGTYAVTGLSSGNYRVCVDVYGGGEYASQCYRDVTWSGDEDHLPAGATKVSVGVGQVKTGIDFTLRAKGSIQGTVTSAGNQQPVEFAHVYVFDSSNTLMESRFADFDGSYDIEVGPGNYKVCVDPRSSGSDSGYSLGLAAQCYTGTAWDGRLSNVPSAAKAVPVLAGTDTLGRDIALTQGSAISGKLTSAAGANPLGNVSVYVFDGDKAYESSTSSNADGTWTVTGLSAGPHIVCFEGARATDEANSVQLGYLDSCYSGKSWGGVSVEPDVYDEPAPLPDGTQGVPTVAGQTKTGVNATLARAGAVTGTVTSAGSPAGFVEVSVFTTGGARVGAATSDASGTYLVPGLVGADYWVCFDGGNGAGTGYLSQCHSNKAWNADPYDLPEGLASTRVIVGSAASLNQTLGQGGAISGKVTDAFGNVADADLSVIAYSSSGTFLSSASVDSETGEYTVKGLPSGNVTVCFYSSSYNLQSECYQDQQWNPDDGGRALPEGTTPVRVTVGATTPDIDAKLASTSDD